MGISGAALLNEMNFGTQVKRILECLFDQQRQGCLHKQRAFSIAHMKYRVLFLSLKERLDRSENKSLCRELDFLFFNIV